MASIFKHEPTSQIIRPGKSWRDENRTQQPGNWQIWDADYKASMGIVEIVPESPPDSRFYTWSQNRDGTINKTAKDLADSGSGNTLRLGIKSNLKQAVNGQQGSLLGQTDWYIIRKADKGTAIPSNIQTWRDVIRSKGDAMKSAIEGAIDIAAIEALFVVYEFDGQTIKSGILYDWPELEE